MKERDGARILGAKILVILGDRTLVYLRDDKPDIAYPGVWDIPGGGIEGRETPRQAALRELEEETGLKVQGDRLEPLARYPARVGGAIAIYRLELRPGEEASCRFGAEGSAWQFEPLAAFLARRDAVEPLRAAVAEALSQRPADP